MINDHLISNAVDDRPILLKDHMVRRAAKTFGIHRLHRRFENAWAVIELSGAIARDQTGDLLMRLSFEDAERAARLMSFSVGERGRGD
jgi:hypothetical protein